MRCAFCKKNNAEVCFFDRDAQLWVCDHLCLEGFICDESYETARVAEQPKNPYFQGDRGSLGEATEL